MVMYQGFSGMGFKCCSKEAARGSDVMFESSVYGVNIMQIIWSIDIRRLWGYQRTFKEDEAA